MRESLTQGARQAWQTAILAATLAVSSTGGAAAQTAPRLLVMPFENTTRDARIFWLGEAAAVLLSDDLNALGIPAITREERRAAFERLQVPPAAVLTDATIIRIGELVGASRVIVGSLQLEDETLVMTARSFSLDAGRIQSHVSERGPASELFAICDRLARGLAPSPQGPSVPMPRKDPPLSAFENYIKGLLAVTPSTAINYLNTALQIDPTMDRVRLALWDAYETQGAHDRALAAVTPVPSGSAWFRQARFRAGVSQLHMNRLDDAFTTFKYLADDRATARVLNNLGVVQIRRGSTRPGDDPSYYFKRAAEADRIDPDYFFNLGYAYWVAHDSQSAIQWLREALRRDPADGEAHFVLGAALAAAGNAAEAGREKELARRLSSTYAEWEKRPAAESVPRGLERLKSDVELPRARRGDDALASTGQRDQRGLAQFHVDRGRRLYAEERDREALAELNRALFLSPYLAEAQLLAARIHLRAGRVHDAIDALKISIWSLATAEAHAVLAEAYLALKDESQARVEAQRALSLDPALESAKRTLETIGR
jgi:tetratricopeptide (TPR) repeat protein